MKQSLRRTVKLLLLAWVISLCFVLYYDTFSWNEPPKVDYIEEAMFSLDDDIFEMDPIQKAINEKPEIKIVEINEFEKSEEEVHEKPLEDLESKLDLDLELNSDRLFSSNLEEELNSDKPTNSNVPSSENIEELTNPNDILEVSPSSNSEIISEDSNIYEYSHPSDDLEPSEEYSEPDIEIPETIEELVGPILEEEEEEKENPTEISRPSEEPTIPSSPTTTPTTISSNLFEDSDSDFLETISSPNNKIKFQLRLSDEKCVQYQILLEEKILIGFSTISYETTSQRYPLCKIIGFKQSKKTVSEDWKPIYGPKYLIPNIYSELTMTFDLLEKGAFSLIIRAFDEGIGFQLQFENPETNDIFSSISKIEETFFSTQLNLTMDGSAILYQDKGAELGFKVSQLDQLDSSVKLWPYDLPMHPLTIQYENNNCFAFTEAKNLEYTSLRFSLISKSVINGKFGRSNLSGTNIITPWFTFIIGETSNELIQNSYIVENLNDPCAIEDTTWIIPGKVFRDMALSTSTSKASIDLAASTNMQHILLDAGWYGIETKPESDPRVWLSQPKKAPLNLTLVLEYAKSKSIGVWLYVNDIALEKYIDEILPLYSYWGVSGIKFGFVKLQTPKDYIRILEYVRKCAEYKLMVNIHDYFRPTGYSRTYPNLVSIEGIRGDEHHENSAHALLLPFTRFLAGMADNTFVFEKERLQRMGKTLTHQIALPIIFLNALSHLYWYRDPWTTAELFNEQMLSSTPHLLVWKQMPTSWIDTKVITSKIGEYITIARKAPNGDWFLASATKSEQLYSIYLDFLDDIDYEMERYRDLDDEDPQLILKGTLKIETAKKGDIYSISMRASGGDVSIFKALDSQTQQSLEKRDITSLPWQTGEKKSFDAPISPAFVLPKATGQNDSSLYLFSNDPRGYRVCTMFNVCFDPHRFYIIVEDDEARDYYNAQAQLCLEKSPHRLPFCECSARSMTLTFVKSVLEIENYVPVEENIWVSDHWVDIHQIGHWIEKVVLFHSIFLKADNYNFSKLDRIAFVKTPSPMTTVEELIYNISTSNLPYELKEPLFSQNIFKKPICAPRISASSIMAILATSSEDLQAFRETTGRYLNVDLPSNPECPPSTTYLLLRSEPSHRLRRFINQNQIEEMLSKTFKIRNLQIVTTSSRTTAKDQMKLFGEFGLMISSHSSQLVFSIFSQPKSAIIEVIPTYFNSDFSSIAHSAGLFYQFSVGGNLTNPHSSRTPKDCNVNFIDCDGDPSCYSSHNTCTLSQKGELKEQDFEVDLEVLEKILKKTIDHLDSLCEGHWPGRD